VSRAIPFVKVTGAGNDFILVDGRRGGALGRAPSALAREWCDRKRSIGADGLLLVQPSRRGNARMRIFNPDGSEAEMCGNGLRCVAWYLHSKNGGRHRKGSGRPGTFWSVETGAGLMQAQDTGVPHAVIPVSRLETADLEALGPFIRWHRIFRPKGTNVDLLQIHSPHRISIRTYERGVEQETLACGTGAAASVVIGAALGRLRPPVRVATAGGEKMTVGFRQSRKPWEGLYLEGSARILFEGGIPL
jgi:diaminopimelate epimerase